jgi:hypothetical protein
MLWYRLDQPCTASRRRHRPPQHRLLRPPSPPGAGQPPDADPELQQLCEGIAAAKRLAAGAALTAPGQACGAQAHAASTVRPAVDAALWHMSGALAAATGAVTLLPRRLGSSGTSTSSSMRRVLVCQLLQLAAEGPASGRAQPQQVAAAAAAAASVLEDLPLEDLGKPAAGVGTACAWLAR